MPELALVDTVWIPRELVLMPSVFVDALVDIVWIPRELVLMPVLALVDMV